MIESEVNFQDKQGRKIAGTLRIPEGSGPFPGVIICHGFKGDKDQTHIKAIARAIVNQGIVTLCFDFTKKPGQSSVRFADMTVSYELEVLDQAFDFIKSQKEVDQNNIGLVGHSLGGLIVNWYTSQHPEIKALVNLSAVYSFTETFERHYSEWVKEAKEKGFSFVYSGHLDLRLKLFKNFYDDGVKYETDKVVAEIKSPVLLICGDKDSLLNHSQEYFDKLKTTKEFKIIEGADHNYTNPENLNEVKETVALWFKKIFQTSS